jgi:hypothetical protein
MELINYSPKQQAEYVINLAQKLSADLALLKEKLHDEYGDSVTIETCAGVGYKVNSERFWHLDLFLEMQVRTENSIYDIPLIRYDGLSFIGSKSNDERFLVMCIDHRWLGHDFKKYVSELMRG